MFKDNKLRLLMTLVGFERLGFDDTSAEASWIIPSSVAASDLEESLNLVKKFESSPPTYEDGKSAEEFLRRKPVVRPRAEFDDDSEGDNSISDGEEDFLFPRNGSSTRTKADALEELKTKRRRRQKDPEEGSDSMDDAAREARRETRRKADLKKRLNLKSSMRVHDSDDESDEERDREFFAKEEARRKGQSKRVHQALRSGEIKSENDATLSSAQKPGGHKRKSETGVEKPRPRKKRRSTVLSASEDDETPSNRSRSSSLTIQSDFPLEDTEDEVTDTPLSSPHMQSLQDKLQKSRSASVSAPPSSATAEKVHSAVAALDLDDDNNDDEDDVAPVAKRRPRQRAGFVIDSDSE